MSAKIAALVSELEAVLGRLKMALASDRVEEALGAVPALAAPAGVAPPAGYRVKTKACRDCGQSIVWGVFGNDKPAIIDPESLEVGFELRAGKFGPVPHFEKTRGHLLHDCPSRRQE